MKCQHFQVFLWQEKYKAVAQTNPRRTAATTGITRTYHWSPELKTAVDMAIAARSLDIAS
jgi:hypothetical protein